MTADRVTAEFDVPAAMRDGTVLRANVFRPAGEGPWPVLLTRTPYGKDLWEDTSILDPVQGARKGFIVVIQDTRGRHASDGEFVPLSDEREDGYDSVEWAARLDGSNGRVGMYGESYCGNTQWMAAVEAPPSLAAIAPSVTWSDPMDGVFARGGAIELGVALPWDMQVGFDDIGRRGLGEEELEALGLEMIAEYDALSARGYWELPVRGHSLVARFGLPDLGGLRVLEGPAAADRCRVAGEYERVDIPTLNTGGWYDIFVQGTLDNFVAMRERGTDARLIMGPWSHSYRGLSDPIGDQSFGLLASRYGAPSNPLGDTSDLQLAWFRRHLLPDLDLDLGEKPVRIFVMGRNAWREESDWPLLRAVSERRFLRADGSLTVEAPSAPEEPTEFAYDPADPVPTVGGQTVMVPSFEAGPKDQAGIEARADVCVFTSKPLERELEVTGRVTVVIHARSSAPATDWVARLCDVHPDGRSFNLCDGIVRVEEGADELRRYEIDLWSTSNVFLAGHRLRVHVTSSSFPRWDRNLNTGDQHGSHRAVARQLLHHGDGQPSYIELPVVP
jgi:putative CocE/NonD family hydrolase